MYFLKQKGQDIPIKIGGVLSKAGASSIIYHLEDNDDLVYKEYNEIKEAQDQIHKLKYFIKNPPTQELEPINHLNKTYYQLSWPSEIVYKDREPSGFLMPKIEMSNAISIDKVFSSKNRKKHGFTEDIKWRVMLARNLANVFSELHKNKYLVVDTKPANIFTYKSVPAVCILDCDSFRYGKDYSSLYITDEYIAPETDPEDPKSVKEIQDVFALSVLVFQLLNNGIHPFQGINKTNNDFHIQELINQRSYPYGKEPDETLDPSPVSTHHFFPEDLFDFFDAVFREGKRRKASTLVKILDKYKYDENLAICSIHGHHTFKNGCSTCYINDLTQGKKPSQVSIPVSKSNQQPNKSQQTPKPIPPKSNKTSSFNSFYTLLFGIGGLFFGLWILSIINGANPDNDINEFADITNNKLCILATANKSWKASSSYKAEVKEAKRRGLTCGVLNDQKLCDIATRDGKWETKNGLIEHVNAAKNRGLSCGILISSSTNNQNELSTLSDQSICGIATYTDAKDGKLKFNASGFPRHVKEAQRRNLSCGIISSSSLQNRSEWPDRRICVNATFTNESNQKQWETSQFYRQYYREAKRRGLSCGITDNTANKFEPNIDKAMELFKGKNYDLARIHAEPLAEKGNSTAQMMMGLIYYRGHGLINKDMSQAYKWFLLSASNNHRQAQYYVGLMYENGEGVSQNFLQALEWYERSQKSGYQQANEKVKYLESKLFNLTTGNNTKNFKNKSIWPDSRICLNATSNVTAHKKIWDTSDYYQEYVREAERRGLSCGVSEISNSQNNDLSTWDVTKLCRYATTRAVNGEWEKKFKYQAHVKEAKRRGLSCGVINSSSKNNQNNLKNKSIWSDSQICAKATLIPQNGNRIWETSSQYQPHVKEAKRRGLSCNVKNNSFSNDQNNLKSWNRSKLCRYATKNGKWETSNTYQKHVKEAKRRGLSCGVSSSSSNNQSDLTSWSNSRICGTSTYTDGYGKKKFNNSSFPKHVKEAKRRGLTCGVSSSSSSNNQNNLKNKSIWSDSRICTKATLIPQNGSRRWETRSEYQPHVNEAKRRGLNCGVGSSSSNSQSNNLSGWNDVMLCRYATRSGKWETSSQYQSYVKEAKRRGLSCSVSSSSSNNQNNLSSKSDYMICLNATKNITASKKVWETGDYYQIYVKEAKRRGIACGVASSSSSNNQNTSNNDNSIDNRNVWSDKRICQMATLDIQGTTRWRDKNDNDYGEFVKEAEKRNLKCDVSVSPFSSNLGTN